MPRSRPPTTFFHLPPEIHIRCVQLACDSDFIENHTYRTALSLCLVSKYFVSITTPILYHKLFLTGRSKVLSLSRTFRARPQLSSCVTHVLLSDRCPHNQQGRGGSGSNASNSSNQFDDDAELEVPPTLAFEMPRTREARVDRLQRLQTWLAQRSQALAAFRSAILHVLALTSPCLRALTILLYGHYDRNADSGLSDALAMPFPALRELAICEASLALPWPRIVLPSLQSMHLAAGVGPSLAAALGSIGTSCPRLRRLRLTEPLIDATFTDALSQVLGGSSRIYQPNAGLPGPFTRSTTIRLPLSLARFIIQPTPFHLRGAQPAQGGPNLFQQLTALAEQFDILELVPPAPTDYQSERYPLAIAIRDWFDALSGGRGCWR